MSLKKQTIAKGQSTSLTYDVLGRKKTRTDTLASGHIEGQTIW